MRTNRLISKVFFVLFMTFLMIIAFGKSTLNVKAVNETDIKNAATVMSQYDGITNWKQQVNSPSNQIGNIPIGGNFSLGYTFGAARDSTGKVVGGDKTITKTSGYGTVNKAQTITNSKINVFLNYGGTYYGILHQGANSYNGNSSDTTADPGSASDTSIDYALLTNDKDSYYYNDMNVLRKLFEFDAGTKTSKLFYTGTDIHNKPVFKIVGFYSPLSVFVEVVLRPALSGAPVVQRELYVYNPKTVNNQNNGTKKFQTFFGEDTGLNPNNGDTTVDNVPMKAIGDGQGLYLMSGANYTPASKLFVTNTVDNGFDDFMGRILTNPTNWGIKGKQDNSSASNISNPSLPWTSNGIPTDSQRGDTFAAKDHDLLVGISNSGQTYNIVDGAGKQDSAYTLRWNQTSLDPGKVTSFVSNIGATVSGYAAPSVQKTYTNLTSTSGNHVGDILKFTLKVRNDGYNSTWNVSDITDNLPTGLTFIPGLDVDSSMADGNNIKFDPQLGLSDNSSKTYSFKAQINNQAPYNLTNGNLTNTASFTGSNAGKNDPKTYQASVNVPIETPTFKYRLTKTVKNVSNNETSYVSETNAKKDDILEYQVQFISNGTASLTGAKFVDNLPSGVELMPNTITLNGSSVNATDLNFDVGSLSNNYTNNIRFRAKVTAMDATTASNTAYFNNVKTTSVDAPTSIATEEPAIVNIEAAPKTTSFVEVPTTIDFGSINIAGSDQILSNINTVGKLIINHTEDSAFQVGVSYDNDGDTPISTKNADNTIDEKLIQDGGESLFFNQDDSDSEDHWHPLTDTPTYIKRSGFSGSVTDYDLTDYIGLKKWRLRVPANTKAGAYSGTVTWSITDTP